MPRKRIWRRIVMVSVTFLATFVMLAGYGTVRTYYASWEKFDELNPARNERPFENRYAIQIARRFGLMALFSEVVYRHDLEGKRTLSRDESDCDLSENRRFGMPEDEGEGQWHRLAAIPSTNGVDPSVGCLDDRASGLFYETYVFRDNEERYLEAVIAFRGTENVKGQMFSDWKSNISALFGFEPRQYQQARMKVSAVLDALEALNPDISIYATGHSLGGGLAQQAGYLSAKIKEVTTFNTSPVTNWTTLRLEGQVDNNYPVFFRLYHTGEILNRARQVTTAFTSSRFGRFDIGVQIEPKSLVLGHSMKIFACDFAGRLAGDDGDSAEHHYSPAYAKKHVLGDPTICGAASGAG